MGIVEPDRRALFQPRARGGQDVMVTTKGAAKAPHGSGNARNASAPPSAPAAKADGAPGRLLRVTHDTEYRYAARVESAQQGTPAAARHAAPAGAVVRARHRPRAGIGRDRDRCIRQCARIVCVEPAARCAARAQPQHGTRDATGVVARARGEPPPAIAKPDAKQAMAWEAVRDRLRFRAGQPYDAASEFVFTSPHVMCDPELAAYAAASFTPQRPLVQAAWELMRRVHADFAYRRTAPTSRRRRSMHCGCARVCARISRT